MILIGNKKHLINNVYYYMQNWYAISDKRILINEIKVIYATAIFEL